MVRRYRVFAMHQDFDEPNEVKIQNPRPRNLLRVAAADGLPEYW
jgi:hypothetical protein